MRATCTWPSSARVLAAEQPPRTLSIHVAVANPDLWAQLGALHLAGAENGVSVEHYCRVDRAAQALVDEAERITGGCVDHVHVDGDGLLLARAVTHLVRRCSVAGRELRITASAAAAPVLSSLAEREPWIGAALDRSSAPAEMVAPCALVCLDAGDATSLARAISASRDSGRHTVVVSMAGSVSEATLASVRRGAATVVAVTTDPAVLARDILGQSGIEVMARARHDDYLAQERDAGRLDNASLVPWDELPDSLKLSNRRFAESVGSIVAAAGGRLVPLVGPVPSASWVDDANLETMARAEHDRWMNALVSDGWSAGPAPKDPIRRTHPLLVPWAELSPDDQEKDRDAIRAIPTMLARVGYALSLA